jgi:hypothetical protein
MSAPWDAPPSILPLNLFGPDQTYYAMFDMVVAKRNRGWEWRVIDPSGKTVMCGRGPKRLNARYQAERALFLLLMTARTRELDREDNM